MRIHTVINAVRVHTTVKHLRAKKRLKTIKIFLYALGLAIFQGGIAAQTLNLMQGSERKKKKKTHSESLSSRDMLLLSAQLEPERGNRQTHGPTTTLPGNCQNRFKVSYLSSI